MSTGSPALPIASSMLTVSPTSLILTAMQTAKSSNTRTDDTAGLFMAALMQYQDAQHALRADITNLFEQAGRGREGLEYQMQLDKFGGVYPDRLAGIVADFITEKQRQAKADGAATLER